MISTVSYTSASGSSVAIALADGTVWFDDANLPADTAIRRQLAEWLAAGGVIEPYRAPEPTFDEQRAAVWDEFNHKADALSTRMDRAKLFDGSGLTTAEALIQAEYAALIAARNAAIDAIDEAEEGG